MIYSDHAVAEMKVGLRRRHRQRPWKAVVEGGRYEPRRRTSVSHRQRVVKPGGQTVALMLSWGEPETCLDALFRGSQRWWVSECAVPRLPPQARGGK